MNKASIRWQVNIASASGGTWAFFIALFSTGSAGPKVVEGDETDRAPTDKLCFDFMSKGICANAFCPSRHFCTNLGSWLQEMKSMSERCVRHHHTIVSTLSVMLNGTSPLHRELLESHCNVNDFHISKLLMAIIRVSSIFELPVGTLKLTIATANLLYIFDEIDTFHLSEHALV
jgi:hypothetical protein